MRDVCIKMPVARSAFGTNMPESAVDFGRGGLKLLGQDPNN